MVLIAIVLFSLFPSSFIGFSKRCLVTDSVNDDEESSRISSFCPLSCTK